MFHHSSCHQYHFSPTACQPEAGRPQQSLGVPGPARFTHRGDRDSDNGLTRIRTPPQQIAGSASASRTASVTVSRPPPATYRHSHGVNPTARRGAAAPPTMKKGYLDDPERKPLVKSDKKANGPKQMKLGVAYNVFDGEELLKDSIRSIKPNVDYVAVVYQTVSNFGNPCHPKLEARLKHLVDIGLVDELHKYEMKSFTDEEKAALCSPISQEIGGPPSSVSTQFYHEIMKRDIGRKMCAAQGCNYFMSMDTDEFYKEDELAYAKRKMLEDNLDGTSCKMRFYFKEPTYEMLPFDEMNQVPLIYKLQEGCSLLLAHPYPCVVDPTRRMSGVKRFYQFERSEVKHVRNNTMWEVLAPFRANVRIHRRPMRAVSIVNGLMIAKRKVTRSNSLRRPHRARAHEAPP